ADDAQAKVTRFRGVPGHDADDRIVWIVGATREQARVKASGELLGQQRGQACRFALGRAVGLVSPDVEANRLWKIAQKIRQLSPGFFVKRDGFRGIGRIEHRVYSFRESGSESDSVVPRPASLVACIMPSWSSATRRANTNPISIPRSEAGPAPLISTRSNRRAIKSGLR